MILMRKFIWFIISVNLLLFVIGLIRSEWGNEIILIHYLNVVALPLLAFVNIFYYAQSRDYNIKLNAKTNLLIIAIALIIISGLFWCYLKDSI
jgi:hypothetical protein